MNGVYQSEGREKIVSEGDVMEERDKSAFGDDDAVAALARWRFL